MLWSLSRILSYTWDASSALEDPETFSWWGSGQLVRLGVRNYKIKKWMRVLSVYPDPTLDPDSWSFNPHLPSGLSHPYLMDESISSLRGVWCTFYIFILFLIEIPVRKRCRPWSDARFAVSDLGLHCWPRSKKRDARLIWVKPLLLYQIHCLFKRPFWQNLFSFFFRLVHVDFV